MGVGCIHETSSVHRQRRKKCQKIANDAAERAGEMIIDLANRESNKLSDELTEEASKKLDDMIADIQKKTDEFIAALDVECQPNHQKSSPPMPVQDCIDASTTKARDQAEQATKGARVEHKTEMDRSVRLSENKKNQILVDSENQQNEARDMVLRNCDQYLNQ